MVPVSRLIVEPKNIEQFTTKHCYTRSLLLNNWNITEKYLFGQNEWHIVKDNKSVRFSELFH